MIKPVLGTSSRMLPHDDKPGFVASNSELKIRGYNFEIHLEYELHTSLSN